MIDFVSVDEGLILGHNFRAFCTLNNFACLAASNYHVILQLQEQLLAVLACLRDRIFSGLRMRS